MNVLCLDLEGVLIPEIWRGVAERTGIDELGKTTRDIPVYDELMQLRLAALARHDVSMSLIQEVIAGLEPLPDAAEFLDWARQDFQVAIISDTFYQFALPFMAKLGWPMLLCHQLQIENDRITGYHIRQPDPKRCSVRAFKSLDYRVLAVGDSYNDIPMLEEADRGVFFRAPANVLEEFPRYPSTTSYGQLQQLLSAASTD